MAVTVALPEKAVTSTPLVIASTMAVGIYFSSVNWKPVLFQVTKVKKTFREPFLIPANMGLIAF